MTKTTKALETLKAGGYFRKALERSYHGGEKFKTRLYTAGGDVVKGVGEVTFYALLDAKALRNRDCIRSSAYAQEWEWCSEVRTSDDIERQARLHYRFPLGRFA